MCIGQEKSENPLTVGEFIALLEDAGFPQCQAWLDVVRNKWPTFCRNAFTPESAEGLGIEISRQISHRIANSAPLTERRSILAASRDFLRTIWQMANEIFGEGEQISLEKIDQIEVPPDLEA